MEVPTEPPQEPEETVRDDLDIVMDAIEPSDNSEGAGEAAWSTETEVQSSPWKDRERVLDSMPWVRLHSRRPLEVLDLGRIAGEDEPEENVEDETGLIGPADVLMTKSQGAPSSSTASSVLDKRQYSPRSGTCSTG